ncbi:hypothetical protein FRC12_011443 [Ceratobasidium sp. 428]|nr:hypothetical protein FRC12_011443 [Ceratobasidium sp. 428]
MPAVLNSIPQPAPAAPKQTLNSSVIPEAMPSGKSIIVFCDGTGQDGLTTSLTAGEAAALLKEKAETSPVTPALPVSPYPTNVLRLSRCVPLRAPTEPRQLQLVFYQSGVGAGDDFRGASDFGDDYERARGTATGKPGSWVLRSCEFWREFVSKGSKIRDAYNFIAQNYDDGDRIYLFGFSRGAYTARKVAGLICRLGLLDRREMGKFFYYWSALDRNDSKVDIKRGREAKVQFVGTWDTVGSVYEELSSAKLNALTLVDTDLPEGVRTARHALAYHENRKEFLPTPYIGYDKDRDVQQVYQIVETKI